MSSPASQSGDLCLTCGLCCDGSLFGSVELLLEDNLERLRFLGIPVRNTARRRFSQPCAALLEDRSCEIYSERPCQCRRFNCALLTAVGQGRVSRTNAVQTIRRTRAKADAVRRLLRELGEHRESSPLSRRFQSVKRRMEDPASAKQASEEDLERFASLSLAVHELQFLLRREFYPDPADLRG